MKQNKNRKDRIFVWSMSAVVANLVFWFINRVLALVDNVTDFKSWLLVIVTVIGIVGVLYLIQNNRQRRRITSEQEK